MRIRKDVLKQIISDLGINVPFVKGQDVPVSNCWHFYTDGHAVDFIFSDEEDFKHGMNRVFVVSQCFDVIVLAFVLMDTHVHFILYGSFENCNKFIHEYIRRTSIYISRVKSERKKLCYVPIGHQKIDTNRYLKSVICYVLKNPTVGGLPWMFYDYPWSSGPLYFRSANGWTSPNWSYGGIENEHHTISSELSKIAWKHLLRTRSTQGLGVKLIGDVVFPGEYVAVEIVEQLFKSPKSFMFFLGSTKDSDIESRGGVISNLTIPDHEMRQHKNEVCLALFGTSDSHKLDTEKRIRLARRLRSSYNSSSKQIARICGLKYDEVKDLL